MKTFNEVVNQPTNTDGTMKRSNWLTKLAESGLSVVVDGTATINDKEICLSTAIVRSLESFAQGAMSLEENLLLLEKGYASSLQHSTAQKIAAKGVSVAKLSPLDNNKKQRTSTQYKSDCLHYNEPDKQEIYNDIELALLDSKLTKDKAVQLLQTIALRLFTQEQLDCYNSMVESEIAAAKEFEKVTAVGFFEVEKLKDNKTISAKIHAMSYNSGTAALLDLGYKFNSASLPDINGNIVVVFEKGEQETIV